MIILLKLHILVGLSFPLHLSLSIFPSPSFLLPLLLLLPLFHPILLPSMHPVFTLPLPPSSSSSFSFSYLFSLSPSLSLSLFPVVIQTSSTSSYMNDKHARRNETEGVSVRKRTKHERKKEEEEEGGKM